MYQLINDIVLTCLVAFMDECSTSFQEHLIYIIKLFLGVIMLTLKET